MMRSATRRLLLSWLGVCMLLVSVFASASQNPHPSDTTTPEPQQDDDDSMATLSFVEASQKFTELLDNGDFQKILHHLYTMPREELFNLHFPSNSCT